MTDNQPTVRDRLTTAGLSPERIEQHHTARAVRLNGEIVDDLDQPTEPGSRINVWGG